MALEAAAFELRIRFLRDLAEEVRTIAEAMHDLSSRRTMLMIAASYLRMAEHLEGAAHHLSVPQQLSLPTTRSPRPQSVRGTKPTKKQSLRAMGDMGGGR